MIINHKFINSLYMKNELKSLHELSQKIIIIKEHVNDFLFKNFYQHEFSLILSLMTLLYFIIIYQ